MSSHIWGLPTYISVISITFIFFHRFPYLKKRVAFHATSMHWISFIIHIAAYQTNRLCGIFSKSLWLSEPWFTNTKAIASLQFCHFISWLKFLPWYYFLNNFYYPLSIHQSSQLSTHRSIISTCWINNEFINLRLHWLRKCTLGREM